MFGRFAPSLQAQPRLNRPLPSDTRSRHQDASANWLAPGDERVPSRFLVENAVANGWAPKGRAASVRNEAVVALPVNACPIDWCVVTRRSRLSIATSRCLVVGDCCSLSSRRLMWLVVPGMFHRNERQGLPIGPDRSLRSSVPLGSKGCATWSIHWLW